MSTEFIVCDPEKCTGCGICELACSEIKEKSFNKLYSRIHAVRLESLNEPIRNMSLACFHCKDPVCVKVCPRDALSQNEETGVINVDTDFLEPKTCHVNCGWCQAACEFGAIILNPKISMAAVCDLCPDDRVDGETPCVRSCPKGALSLATIDKVEGETEDETAKKILKELAQARENSKTFYQKFGYMPMPPMRGLLESEKMKLRKKS